MRGFGDLLPTEMQCRAAQVHASLALYEGLYELLGDGSTVDDTLRQVRSGK